MAEKAVRKSGEPNKKMLIIALAFIVVSILWSVYELTRARTADEIRILQEDAKVQADIDRANKKKGP